MPNDVATLVQGGAVGISILLILYMLVKEKMIQKERAMYNKTINNHLSHLDNTLGRLDATMQNIAGNHEQVKGAIENNTRVVSENMNMMERLKGFLSVQK